MTSMSVVLPGRRRRPRQPRVGCLLRLPGPLRGSRIPVRSGGQRSLDKTAQVQTEFLAVEFEASYCRKLGTQRVGRLTGRLCLPHVRFRTWIQLIDVTHSKTATSSTSVADEVQEEDDTVVNALIKNARRLPKQLYQSLT